MASTDRVSEPVETLRSLRFVLRGVIHRLPESSQRWLRRTTDALRRRDHAPAIHRLRLTEQAALAAATRATPSGRKRVLISLLQQFPPVMHVGYGLATALRLRGHEVRGVVCDGIMPRCELNLGGGERPPCGVCAAGSRRYADAYGFEFGAAMDLLSTDDRAAAEARVAGTSPGELAALRDTGVPVGAIARRELQRCHRGFVFHPETDPEFPHWIVSAMLAVRLAGRLLDREQPEILIVSSGRTLVASCLIEVARARGIRTVSWDLENSHPDGLVFSHDEPAVLLPLDEAWSSAAHEHLTAGARDHLLAFMRRWAASDGTPFPYNQRPLADAGAIRSALGLRGGAPLIVAFANAAWDMAAVDRDAGFGSMFEWLFALVEYAIRHPEVDLVVRAHPAEVRVPADLRSRTPVVSEIAKRFSTLPAHVKLVPGGHPVSSYVLAEMAQAPIMYATRLGLEMALRGRCAWLAGETTYRGRGFTRDITSRAEMESLLDRRVFDETLSVDQIARAERFAHLWFFRYVTRLPLLRPAPGQPPVVSFLDFAPGRHPTLDRLCGAIADGTPFLDLHHPSDIPPPRVKSAGLPTVIKG